MAESQTLSVSAIPQPPASIPPQELQVSSSSSTSYQDFQNKAHPQPATAASTGGQRPPGPGSGTYLNPRSCVTCRKRKVKCNKEYPCSNCVRGNTECKFPAPGRAPRRPRKPPDSELLSRLRKLEGVVQSLGVHTEDGSLAGSPKSQDHHDDTKSPDGYPISHQQSPTDSDGKRVPSYRQRGSSIDRSFGRLVLDEGKSRFISNSFWANLSEEVEDVRSILHEYSDDESDEVSPGVSVPDTPDHHHGFVFSHASSPEAVHSVHPSPHVVMEMWRIHEENVDPLIKLLHLPTVRQQLEAVKDSPGSASKGFEALMFSMYFTSVTSLSGEDCEAITGESRQSLLMRFRPATERALARANFMVTDEIVVLQALVLFMISLRRHEDPRMLWSMTGLLARIAVTLGLHRDPTNFGLSPFDTEVRRRLFWSICNVDVRLSEDFGADPIIFEHTFDTRYPLNISDSDFHPDMGPMQDKEGITEMTFSLIRYEVAEAVRKITYAPPAVGKSAMKFQPVSIQDKERWIEECHQHLEEKYLRFCDMNQPIHWVICTVARLILAKMWLTIYQPYQRLNGGAALPQQTRDRLFITSLESIEFALLLETEVRTVKWGWLFKSYSQWHALAFLLSELCHRTKGPTVLRAWRAVDAVVRVWGARVPTHKRDHLWRPLRKLMAKARAARDRELAPDNNMAQIKPDVDGRTSSIPRGSQTPYNDFTCGMAQRSGSMDSSPHTDTSTAFAGTSGRATSSSSSVPSFSGFGFPPASSSSEDEIPLPHASPFFANQPQLARECEWVGDSFNNNNGYLNDILMGNDGDLDPVSGGGTAPGSLSVGGFGGPNGGAATPTPLQNPGFAMNPNVMQMNQYPSSGPGGVPPGVNGFVNGSAHIQQQPLMQQQRGGLIGDGPMVSGIDNDPSGRLPDWDDWNEMVRSFELEATTEDSTPGAPTPGIAGGRRPPVVGAAWF